MRYLAALMLVLTFSGCAKNQPLPVASGDGRREQLVGEWMGGGFLPVVHRFSADGTYQRELPAGTNMNGVKAAGTWQLRGDELVRTIDGREEVVRILRFEKDFFQIQTADGGKWGYHRRAATGGRG